MLIGLVRQATTMQSIAVYSLIYRDAMIISIMDTFTSLLAGFTIFATLGNLAFELDVDIADVVKGGPGLAFVSYPDAISKFPFAQQVRH
jgi:solute carrier family 6 amino acid transporter-like protein 5/7/9/14